MKLKDLITKLKTNEKEFYLKVKDFHGDDDIDKKKKEMDDKYFQTQLLQ